MGVIVDTSIWVDIERGRLSTDDVALAVGGEQVLLTPMTVAEFQYGVMRADTEERRSRRAALLARMKAKPCLSADATTGEIFGTIAAQVDARGRASQHRVQDLWIASLAIQHGHKVLTRNLRDFEDIPGLTVIAPPDES